MASRKKSLIFLTKQYPYYYDEPYVAAELVELCKEFERVYIYPLDHFEHHSPIIFPVPNGAEVIKLSLKAEKNFSKTQMIFAFINAYIYEFTRTHSKSWFLKYSKNFFNNFITQYALGIGLERFAKSKGLDNNNTLYYSFWLSNQSLCLSIMKQRKAIEHFYCRAHSLDLYHEDWGLIKSPKSIPPFRNFKLKQVDAVFPVSKHGENNLKSKRKDLNAQVRYLGVYGYELNPSPSNDGVFRIVTCSSVDRNKRVHLLGQALSAIDRPVHWTHFGTGKMIDQLMDSVRSENVQFDFRGWTDNVDVRKYYSERPIDLFVNLSIVEGLPVSIMEVLSHGIPVLATSIYGTPEAVIEGVSGKLISGNFTQDQLIEALRWCMDNPEVLHKLRFGARKVFEEKFDAQKNHAAFAKYLASLP